MRYSFSYPVKPWFITQAWGIYNASYQRFGFWKHNGIDVAHGSDKAIRIPYPGTIIRTGTPENGDWQPSGGGIFFSHLSDVEYDFDDGRKAYVLLDALHCEHIKVSFGQKVLRGLFAAVQGNTGFSTGPHTHFQWRRVKKQPLPAPVGVSEYRIQEGFWLEDIDRNDANNSFDPSPYFTGKFVFDEEVSAIQKALDSLSVIIRSLTPRKSRLEDWARAIEKFENMSKFHPKNNNPGALRWSPFESGKIGGYAAFASYAEGWKALIHQLRIAADGRSAVYRPTDNLLQFSRKYAPSDDNNNPDNYADFVAKELGVPITTQIKELL